MITNIDIEPEADEVVIDFYDEFDVVLKVEDGHLRIAVYRLGPPWPAECLFDRTLLVF